MTRLPRKQPAPVEVAAAPTASVRLGRWEDVIADVRPDTVIVDAPYSGDTHTGALDADDGYDGSARLAINYDRWGATNVEAFVSSWAPRTGCWLVSITDSVLSPLWIAAYERHGLYAFPRVGIVITGMGVRIQGDGPSSWTLDLCVARRRANRLSTAPDAKGIWRTLPGAYVGPCGPDQAGGRGKPSWLLDALVRDYSDPGMTIADPCAGWGSTLVSARNAGRHAIGAEIDPAAYERCRHALSGDMTAYARAAPKREREIDPDRPGLFDALGSTP